MDHSQAQNYINQNQAFLGLNNHQKHFIFSILKGIKETDISKFLDLVLMPRKLGFNFDSFAPPLKNVISLPVETKPSLNINLKSGRNSHFLIIGENYEALNFLQITHRQAIDLIYIDPPYGTESAKTEGNSTASGKFTYFDKFTRTGWLNMINHRLKIAINLLKPTGIIMISINDKHYAYLKVLMDQLLEEQNFIATIVWQSSFGGKNDSVLPVNTEYIIVYVRDRQLRENYQLNLNKVLNIKKEKKYTKDDWNHKQWGKYFEEPLCRSSLTYQSSLDFIVYVKKSHGKIKLKFSDPKEKEWHQIIAGSESWNLQKKIKQRQKRFDGSYHTNDWRWYWSAKTMANAYRLGFLSVNWNEKKKTFSLRKRTYEGARFNGKKDCVEEVSTNFIKFRNLISDPQITTKVGNQEIKQLGLVFSNPKPVNLILKLLKLALPQDKKGVVLDFFAGSGTTAQALLKMNPESNTNHQFILVTNDESFVDTIKNKTQQIASDVTWPRLNRIITGCEYKTFNNENARFSNPFLNTKLYCFKMQHFNIGLDMSSNNISYMLDIAKSSIKILAAHHYREDWSNLEADLNNFCRALDLQTKNL